jgi:hypothetical protein
MAGEAAGCGDPGSPCARPQAPVLSRHQRFEVALRWHGPTQRGLRSPAVGMPPDGLCMHDGGVVCWRGATPTAASHWLATAKQGQGVGGGGLLC